MGPPYSDRITRVPPYSSPARRFIFRIQGYHLLWHAFPDVFAKQTGIMRARTVPLSLATTEGISVDFFSSGYLDVSVHRVRFTFLCIQNAMPAHSRRVSPFGDPRIDACCRLPGAYRRLPRPSSPSIAKASTARIWSLDPIALRVAGKTVFQKEKRANYGVVLTIPVVRQIVKEHSQKERIKDYTRISR